METIKIYDLENDFSGIRNIRLKSDLRITVSPVRGKSKGGSRLLTFNFENEALQKGFNKMNFAENSLTGDIYIILSKQKGVQLKQRVGRQGYVCTKNSIVDLLLKLLCKEVKQIRMDVSLSSNLSKSDDKFTYKIDKTEILN